MKAGFAIVWIATFSSLLVVGCGKTTPAPTPSTEVTASPFELDKLRPMIEAKNQAFTRAHVTGDRAMIDGMFTDDARVLPPNADPVIGRKAIDELTAQYIAYGISDFREETEDFYGNEQFLVDQGSYTLTYGEEKTVETGKYLNVWKQLDGEWKIYSNIWNTNAPAPASE